MNETPVIRTQVPDTAGSVGPDGSPVRTSLATFQLRFDSAHNDAASKLAGAPVFDKVLVLRHLYPGTADYLDVQLKRYPADGSAAVVLDDPRMGRFAAFVTKFENDDEMTVGGTPLATLNFDPAQIATMQAQGIHSTEMLSDVTDASLGNLGNGGRAMRDRARAFFAALEGNAPVAKLQAENDAMAQQLADMRSQMADMQADLRASAAAKPGKGA